MLNELLTRLRFLLTRKAHCEVDEVLQSHLEQCRSRSTSLHGAQSLETQEFVMGRFYYDWRANLHTPSEALTLLSSGMFKKLFPSNIRYDFHLKVRSLRDRQMQDVQLTAVGSSWAPFSRCFSSPAPTWRVS